MNFYDAIRTRSLFISFLGLLVLSSCSDSFGYYQAEKGRWMSRDLIGEEGGLNLYGFTGNNAVHRIDPLGLSFGTYYYGVGGLSFLHRWLRVGTSSYGWWPTVDWDKQTTKQKALGVPGELRSPDTYNSGIPGNTNAILEYSETKLLTKGTLTTGSGKGRECACLKEGILKDTADIHDCIDKTARAESGSWHITSHNCRQAAQKWLGACCLETTGADKK